MGILEFFNEKVRLLTALAPPRLMAECVGGLREGASVISPFGKSGDGKGRGRFFKDKAQTAAENRRGQGGNYRLQKKRFYE